MFYYTINTIDAIFHWGSEEGKNIIFADSLSLIISILIITLYCLIKVISIIKKNKQNVIYLEDLFSNIKNIGKYLCHFVIFVGIIARSNFLVEKVQTDPFLESDAIMALYEFAYSFGRLILIYYFIHIFCLILSKVSVKILRVHNSNNC